MILEENIVQYYEYFYSKKYSNQKYIFTPSSRAIDAIAEFIQYLEKRHKLITLGQRFLSRYFSFQFKRVENMVIKRFSSKDKSGRIQIYDIIGRKAIEYWESRDVEYDYTLIHTVALFKEPLLQKEVINLAEELERKRFFNTNRGQVNCLEKTTLFNHKSTNCLLCNFKRECKLLLKVNYQHIYMRRGYGTTA